MNTPTAAEVRARSELLRVRVPVAEPPADPDPLDPDIREAAGLVMSLTARRFDDIDAVGTAPMGCSWEEIPAYLEPQALRAVVAKTEELVLGNTRKARQSELGSVRLRSFTAGPYSETYFGPEDAAKLKALDPNAMVAQAMWALATACAQAAWLALWREKQPAAGAVKRFSYARRSGGY